MAAILSRAQCVNYYIWLFINIHLCFVCRGMMVQLNINQTQYPVFTDAVGVRIAVTPHNELPRPDVFGFGIPPGKVAFMAIKKVITSSLTFSKPQ